MLILSGLDPTSPIPRLAREFRPAQGPSRGAAGERRVVLIANKLTAGSETVETLGERIRDQQDCIDRFGRRSEARYTYDAFVAVDPLAPIYIVSPAEGGSATAATVTFVVGTTSTVATTLLIETLGRTLEVQVSVGDTAGAIATAIVAKINADPDLPYSAAVSSTVNVDITTSQLGVRSGQWLNQLRMRWYAPNATTVTKGSVTAGTVADSVTNAIVAVDSAEHCYHVLACTALAGVTTTDGGVGEYSTYIKNSIGPAAGKNQMFIAAVDGTSSQAVSVATSAAVNTVFGHIFRAKANDWPPCMIAAHNAAAMRLQQKRNAAANLANYSNTEATPYLIPDPYVKTNRPSPTEQDTDLRGGVSTIGFRSDGSAYIVRQITTYSWIGSSATKDYRAREGHIGSVLISFWEQLADRYVAQRQPFIADDPPEGRPPTALFDYPKTIRTLVSGLIDNLAGVILDPSPAAVAAMKKTIDVQLGPDGFSVAINVLPVRHNLKQYFQINQTGPAY